MIISFSLQLISRTWYSVKYVKMKVSIIIPVYNVSHYIRRCLQSVVDQTYTNLECILVDDCGSDNSMDLAQDYIKGYKGNIAFTILRHESNKGQSAARNTALRVAKGQYVYFLDSDDSITTNCIESLMFQADKHPEADFIQGNTLDNTGNISHYGWNTHLPEFCNNHDELENYLLFVVVTSAWNKLIKREFIINNQLYFPEGIIHEDLYWCFFLAKYTKAVSFVNEGTYFYYINDNSTITAPSKEARIRRYTSRLYASDAFCEELGKNQKASKCQRLYLAGNLTCTMIEVAALHSLRHWSIFWRHVIKLYFTHSKLSLWQHIFFLFLMPPLCFPIGIKGWYWRVQRYIVNRI